MYGPVNKVRVFIYTAAVLFCAQVELFGAPHNGDLYTVRQPDGSYVQVSVWGDEFYQRPESLDGYTVVRDPNTYWICYARLNDDASELLSTGIIYHGTAIDETADLKMKATVLGLPKHLEIKTEVILQKVTQARLKFMGPQPAVTAEAEAELRSESLTGDVNGLTLLIDFPDDPATISRQEIENYVNQIGYTGYGNNGSVRDYFSDVSGGLLNYTNYATEYYTAAHNKSYYTDESVEFGERACELINEALAWLDGEGFDFSTLSTDSGGHIRAINALYAGTCTNTWAEGLWPHKNYLSPVFSADGVRSLYYQITDIDVKLQLRTFCHENGHMLFGWPDLYDYGHDSKGIGHYGLMAGGASNYNPVPPNPSLRSEEGWETVIDITDVPAGSLISHTANSLTTYRYSHPNNPDEYFLIESRVRSGRNAAIPDEGLLIWHVDEAVPNNDHQEMTAEEHYRVSVEQADGLFHLENNDDGDAGDLFHAGYADQFHDYTTPNSKWWSGEDSGLSIYNVSAVGETMSFTINPVCIRYVDDDAPGDPNPGDPTVSDPHEDGSGGHPYDSIQEAVEDVNHGDIIIVLDGTYTGAGNYDIDTHGLAITIKSQQGPEQCVIDCRDQGRAFIFQTGEDANTAVDGFTITGGDPGTGQNGGAIRCNQSGPKITNCIIVHNYADWSGGAISLENGSDAAISRCTITDNECRGSGGAIFNLSSSPTILNCLIAGNRGKWSGALTSAFSSNLTVVSSTIADNNGMEGTGGLECYFCSSLAISNSIVWNNVDEQITNDSGTVTVTYSDIQMADSSTWPGTGNMNDDPLFADANDRDYHLKSAGGRWNAVRDNNCDFNNDGSIDYLDLEVLCQSWLEDGSETGADVDASGWVDLVDLAILAGHWGASGLEVEGWVVTDPVSSPCIDKGDPSSAYSREPAPNGGRINMGAYGNTPEASKSPP